MVYKTNESIIVIQAEATNPTIQMLSFGHMIGEQPSFE